MEDRTDSVKLQVGIRPCFRTIAPTYTILIDHQVLFASEATIQSDFEYTHDFDLELTHDDHELCVRFDPVANTYSNIEISAISVNGKYLQEDERYHLARYYLDTEREIDGELTDCYESICLGWPGEYRLPFTVPVLFWCLRNLKGVEKQIQRL